MQPNPYDGRVAQNYSIAKIQDGSGRHFGFGFLGIFRSPMKIFASKLARDRYWLSERHLRAMSHFLVIVTLVMSSRIIVTVQKRHMMMNDEIAYFTVR